MLFVMICVMFVVLLFVVDPEVLFVVDAVLLLVVDPPPVVVVVGADVVVVAGAAAGGMYWITIILIVALVLPAGLLAVMTAVKLPVVVGVPTIASPERLSPGARPDELRVGVGKPVTLNPMLVGDDVESVAGGVAWIDGAVSRV